MAERKVEFPQFQTDCWGNEVCVRGAKKWVEETDKIGQEGLQTFIARLVAFR